MARNMQGFSNTQQIERRITMIHVRREQFKEQVAKTMNIAIGRSIPKINSVIKELKLEKGTTLQVNWKFDFIQNFRGNHDIVGTLCVSNAEGIVLYETLNHILFEGVNLRGDIYTRNWDSMKRAQMHCEGIRFRLGQLIESEKAFIIKV